MTEDIKSKKLEQVRLLLEKAASTPFEAEADTYRAKADQLMTSFAIEQWELDQLKPRHEREKPEKASIEVVSTFASPLRTQLVDLFTQCCFHTRCRPVFYGLADRTQRMKVSAVVIGFPSDIRYCEMLFTSLSIQLAATTNPVYNDELSVGENAWIFKAAGMKWEDICRKWDIPFTEGGKPSRERQRMYADYKRFCKQTGKQQIASHPAIYLDNFATGFVTSITTRFLAIKNAEREVHASTGSGAELVLVDIKKEIDDAFNAEWEGKLSTGVALKTKSFDATGYGAGRSAGEKADISTDNKIANRPKSLN